MADCDQLLTNQDLSNAKKDATTMNDFVESNQDSIVSKNGKTIRTLEGINNDAQDAIDSFKLKSKGQYLPDPITLNDGFEYVVYLDKTYFAISPPYTTDPVTYPTPDLDTVNLIEQSYLTRSFGEKIAGDGDSQLAGGPIWPLSSQEITQNGDTFSDIKVIRLSGGDFTNVNLFQIVDQTTLQILSTGTITNINLTSKPYSCDLDGSPCYLVNQTLGGVTTALGWGVEVGASGSHEDNTKCIRALSLYIKNNGGMYDFPEGRLNVGWQNPDISNAPNEFYFQWSEHVLEVVDGLFPIEVHFEGTEFHYLEGQYFGRFDTSQPQPYPPIEPEQGMGQFSACGRIIEFIRCPSVILTGKATIFFKGDTALIGGRIGNTGIQADGTGVYFRENGYVECCPIAVHDAPLDGYTLNWSGLLETDDPKPVILNNPQSYYAFRQGLSVVGGKNITINNPVFAYTGRGQFRSLPSAGIDFEPEGGAVIMNVIINNPEIKYNFGAAILHAFAGAKNYQVNGGRLIGDIGQSIFSSGENQEYNNVLIAGRSVNQFNSTVTFNNCLFTLDPADVANEVPELSGTRFDFNNNPCLIRNSVFRSPAGKQLPFSTQTRFDSCTFESAQDDTSFLRGIFIGRNQIDITGTGNNDFGSALRTGDIILNGTKLAQDLVSVRFRQAWARTTDSSTITDYMANNGFNDSFFNGAELERGDRATITSSSITSAYAQLCTTAGINGSTAVTRNYGSV